MLMFEIIQFPIKKYISKQVPSTLYDANRQLPISLYCRALCQYSSCNSCFLVEADIAISTLTNIIIVTLVRATNNYKVAAETIFLSVVPLTQSVKGYCNLHFT